MPCSWLLLSAEFAQHQPKKKIPILLLWSLSQPAVGGYGEADLDIWPQDNTKQIRDLPHYHHQDLLQTPAVTSLKSHLRWKNVCPKLWLLLPEAVCPTFTHLQFNPIVLSFLWRYIVTFVRVHSTAIIKSQLCNMFRLFTPNVVEINFLCQPE